jgi:type 1 fimbria pilin
MRSTAATKESWRGGMRNAVKVVTIMAVTLLGLGACSDINRQNGPVELLVTITQNISTIDIETGATGCNVNLGTVNLRSLFLQGGQSQIPTDNRFNDIQLRSYRVTYVRTDGGHQVPEPFVRTISGTLAAGASSSNLNNFQGFQPGAFDQAPFAALLPQNGGRDPETGKAFVQLDTIIEVFGETVAGERVSGSARAPLTFCFHCGGCR